MGSRGGRHAALSRAVALAAVAGACGGSAPPGFSGGREDRWSFPLVAPLENGVLLTAVTINTHGPYVFAIDPDAGISVVDAEVVRDAKLRTFGGPPRIDESGTAVPRVYAEVEGVELGTLIVERRDVVVAKLGSFDMAGRRIHGVVGRDILADAVVFGFDRDRGLGHLVAQPSFRPPPAAAAIPYELLHSRAKGAQGQPEPRRLVHAKIGNADRVVHLDLGAAASQLRDALWDDAKLVAHDVDASVVDEVGSARRLTRASDPVRVELGPLAADTVFVPYVDQRWDDQAVAGTLGLGFFGAHALWLSWDAHTLYAAPRAPVAPAVRIARWDSPVLAKCQHPGCVEARLIDPLQGKPPDEGKPHPGVVLSIARDEPAGGMDLEIYFEVEGQPLAPYFVLNLPAHVDRVIHQLKPEYLGAKLVVVDASPFPRRCPAANGCVDQVAR